MLLKVCVPPHPAGIDKFDYSKPPLSLNISSCHTLLQQYLQFRLPNYELD